MMSTNWLKPEMTTGLAVGVGLGIAIGWFIRGRFKFLSPMSRMGTGQNEVKCCEHVISAFVPWHGRTRYCEEKTRGGCICSMYVTLEAYSYSLK